MKRETYNLCLRFIAGLAAALILVGGSAILSDKLNEGRTGLLYQASGMKLSDTMLTIDGQIITVEEYLYYVGYGCDALASMGISDLTMDIGGGLTAADFIVQQTESIVIERAVMESWAAEAGIAITAEEQVAIDTQLDGMANVGLSRQFLEGQLRYQYLFESIVAEYTTPGGKLYPDADTIQAAMAAGEDHGHAHNEEIVVQELCNEEAVARCAAAQLTYNDKYADKLDVQAFYAKMQALTSVG